MQVAPLYTELLKTNKNAYQAIYGKQTDKQLLKLKVRDKKYVVIQGGGMPVKQLLYCSC
jgi:hypothetical protein